MASQQSQNISIGEDVRDVAAFEAAAKEIAQIIEEQGKIDTKRCIAIIQEKSAAADLIKKHFPGAMAGSQVLAKAAAAIEPLGMTPENTLFAQSICPDEINHEVGDIPNLFAEYLGEVFHLGGLGGIPFTGKTGFAAFSHHVPNGGHCFILCAPHIGMSGDLQLGKYDREGQTGAGAACGAAVGALAHCGANKATPDAVASCDDYQMAYIIQEISKRMGNIVAAGNDENSKQAALAKETHVIAKEMLEKIVSLDFGDANSTLTILTGVQINMPDPFEDFFQPLSFQIHRKDGSVLDLFAKTFSSK